MHAGVGRSVVVNGVMVAGEDLVVFGRVGGAIELREHMLTILEGGEVHASIVAKSVIVLGRIVGNVEALERLELRESGAISGDVMTPRIAIADGATFNGTVEME